MFTYSNISIFFIGEADASGNEIHWLEMQKSEAAEMNGK